MYIEWYTRTPTDRISDEPRDSTYHLGCMWPHCRVDIESRHPSAVAAWCSVSEVWPQLAHRSGALGPAHCRVRTSVAAPAVAALPLYDVQSAD